MICEYMRVCLRLKSDRALSYVLVLLPLLKSDSVSRIIVIKCCWSNDCTKSCIISLQNARKARIKDT